jgi:hypothetical protein
MLFTIHLLPTDFSIESDGVAFSQSFMQGVGFSGPFLFSLFRQLGLP